MKNGVSTKLCFSCLLRGECLMCTCHMSGPGDEANEVRDVKETLPLGTKGLS